MPGQRRNLGGGIRDPVGVEVGPDPHADHSVGSGREKEWPETKVQQAYAIVAFILDFQHGG